MRTETITVFGDPKGKARPRFFRGHAYTPKSTRDYEKLFADAWGDMEPFTGPICVRVTAFFKPPASASKTTRADMITGKIRPTKKPDIDNILKAALDGLNGHAYKDDSQVVRIKAAKFYAASSCVKVEIFEEVW